MEIQINLRTLDEVRANRIRIEVAEGERAEILADGALMFTQDELIQAQASEGELIAKGRDALIRELEERCKVLRLGNEELAATVDRMISRANELEAELHEANQRTNTFRDQAYRQNDRAGSLQQRLKDAEQERDTLQTRLNASHNRVETVTQHRREAEAEVIRQANEIKAMAERYARLMTTVSRQADEISELMDERGTSQA